MGDDTFDALSEFSKMREDISAIKATLKCLFALQSKPSGCICPAGAEKGCRGLHCPRKPPIRMMGKAL